MAATFAVEQRRQLIRRAVALYEQRLTYEAISEELGVSSTTISKWLREQTSRTCVDCKATLLGPAVDDRCGLCREELIDWLGGSVGLRERAILALRRSGFTEAAIASALAAVGERKSVEEILDCLLGRAARVGVAA